MTLLEVLVGIAIIAVLLGITLPALRGARTEAGALASLANCKNIGLSVSIYAQQNQGRYPTVEADETGSYSIFDRPPHEPHARRVGFSPIWWFSDMWPAVMHDAAPWDENFESWLSPGHGREPPYWPIAVGFFGDRLKVVSYRYSNSFLARPSLWSGSSPADASLIGPTTLADVTNPSLKVLMWDAERAYLRRGPRISTPRPLLFADGSAAARRDTDAAAPVRNPLNHTGPNIYHDTPDGVRGVDFRAGAR